MGQWTDCSTPNKTLHSPPLLSWSAGTVLSCRDFFCTQTAFLFCNTGGVARFFCRLQLFLAPMSRRGNSRKDGLSRESNPHQ